VTVFQGEEYRLKPAVRIFVDEEWKLVVLKSDVPVSADADGFVDMLVDWIDTNFQIRKLPVSSSRRGSNRSRASISIRMNCGRPGIRSSSRNRSVPSGSRTCSGRSRARRLPARCTGRLSLFSVSLPGRF
jgi:hypothetical protein